jgi:hypothetical protein
MASILRVAKIVQVKQIFFHEAKEQLSSMKLDRRCNSGVNQPLVARCEELQQSLLRRLLLSRGSVPVLGASAILRQEFLNPIRSHSEVDRSHN